jgi:hypothetical protein
VSTGELAVRREIVRSRPGRQRREIVRRATARRQQCPRASNLLRPITRTHATHVRPQTPTRRRVWSKKSRFRKHCRERAKFTLKYKTRTKLGIENKRKICPYHDKKQHRACARLETCPDDYVSRARCGTRKRGPPQGAPNVVRDASNRRAR